MYLKAQRKASRFESMINRPMRKQREQRSGLRFKQASPKVMQEIQKAIESKPLHAPQKKG